MPKGQGTRAVVLIGVVGAIAAGLLILATRAKAAPEIPPVVVIPYNVEEMIQEIKQAKSLAELDAYYYYIGQQFITRQISYVEYMALYRAYEARFYELTGVAA